MIDITILAVDIENLERIQETGLSCMMVNGKKNREGGVTIE
jgi:hypothetical protein